MKFMMPGEGWREDRNGDGKTILPGIVLIINYWEGKNPERNSHLKQSHIRSLELAISEDL